MSKAARRGMRERVRENARKQGLEVLPNNTGKDWRNIVRKIPLPRRFFR